ncbi:hypothetical protein [Patulibacter sp. SYSU D01012]|uniref:hypothetical protein n=1 Tax=Patulibacter sp. SYSU D01012 TaxID=2817381 RepID=UPI001B312002|nr:hypothetical protein [Patulibacter sp. SYSU D01012]
MSITTTNLVADRPTGTVDRTPPAPPAEPRATAPAPVAPATPRIARYAAGGTRIGLGFLFLWAFVDKLFGLGAATPSGQGWIDGGNPTQGYLASATGPFAGLYHSLAGSTIVTVLFMFGLLAVGTGLMLGIASRLATIGGVLMVLLMWSSHLWPETNPFMDEHLIYAGTLLVLVAIGADRTLGLGDRWRGTALVQRFPWLG